MPFYSGVIALDGGGVVRATLSGLDPDPRQVVFGAPLMLTLKSVAVDRTGTKAVGFVFEPRKE